MPEIPTRATQFTEAAVITPAKNTARLKDLLARDGKELLGNGTQNIVFIHPRNPNKIVAISRLFEELSPLEAKKTFYLRNILATLFPYNFPRVHAAFGVATMRDNFYHSGTTSARIIPQGNENKHPFSQVQKHFESWKIPSPTENASSSNFLVGQDGGEYYIDKLYITNSNIPIMLQKIRHFIAISHYSDTEKAKVEKYSQRLLRLQGEEKKKPAKSTC